MTIVLIKSIMMNSLDIGRGNKTMCKKLQRKDVKLIVKRAFEQELNYSDIQDLSLPGSERLEQLKSNLSFALKCIRSMNNVEPFSDFSETIADEIMDEIRSDI